MSWGHKEQRAWSLVRRGFLAKYLLVSLLQLNALVAGNGSYILRPCGPDLHGPTPGYEGIPQK